MEKLLEKLSSYNILNNLIPGGAFVWLCGLFGIQFISSSSILEMLFIYYFLGMIVSRVGSLAIETLCKKIKIITYSSKQDYVEATKKDKLIEVLLETSNLYRTCAGMILTVGICRIYTFVSKQFNIPHEITVWMIIVVLLILFVTAFCKQTKHISSRVEVANKSQEE
ncbi:MAG: hypothetical protein RR063_11030 [Anaerovoracaceae bacterium]